MDRKSVWLRGLRDDWRERLRALPTRAPGSFPALGLDAEAGWSEREFARSDLPDGRLRKWLARMGKAWEQCPGQSLTAIFPGRAEQQAAYRFLHNGIRSWVVLLARMVGLQPSQRQPNPGNEVLWRAYVRLQTMVLGMQTLQGP